MSRPRKDLDWDELLNSLAGQGFLGAEVAKNRVLLNFKGRSFELQGDGQRHDYSFDGETSGPLVSVEVVRCVRKTADGERPIVSEYVARIQAGDGDAGIGAGRLLERIES